jgi:cytochrome b561/polyisoprenoid-binding protein YceI
MSVIRDHNEPTVIDRRYSRVAMLLHWAIAATLLFQIGLGLRMDGPPGPETFAVFQLHKSIGITILALTLIRLIWRLVTPPPPLSATLLPIERWLAHAVHIGFYVLLLGLPLTGWLLVSSSKTAVPTILYGIVPFPAAPGVGALDAATKASVNDAAEFSHVALVYAAYVLLALHIAGALKHQFVDREPDLGRMLPLATRSLGIGAAAVLVIAAGMFLFGRTVHLRPIALARTANPIILPPPVTEPEAASAPQDAAPAAESTAPAPAAAEPAATDAKPAAPAEPSVWAVRRNASTLGFHTSWSQGDVDGHFRKWDATIRFSPDALDKSSVAVTIDMASVATGVETTENALPGQDWFATATHPTAQFKASSFRHLAGDRYEARGTLSIRGMSHPVTLPFTLSIKGDVATMAGTVKIDRTGYGVGQGEWGSTDDIPAAVSVNVAIKADRKP